MKIKLQCGALPPTHQNDHHQKNIQTKWWRVCGVIGNPCVVDGKCIKNGIATMENSMDFLKN